MPEIRNNLHSQTILISLAPVIKTSALNQMAGGFERIVRMIPNPPSVIAQGHDPVCFADSISPQEKDELNELHF